MAVKTKRGERERERERERQTERERERDRDRERQRDRERERERERREERRGKQRTLTSASVSSSSSSTVLKSCSCDKILPSLTRINRISCVMACFRSVSLQIHSFTVTGCCRPFTRTEWKKRSEICKHCSLAAVRRSQKFSPRRRPLPQGAGRPKFNQLEMVTTCNYRPSSVKIDAHNFELSW